MRIQDNGQRVDDLVFDTTQRRIKGAAIGLYSNGEPFALDFDSVDGGEESLRSLLSPEELRELAEFMIERWGTLVGLASDVRVAK